MKTMQLKGSDTINDIAEIEDSFGANIRGEYGMHEIDFEKTSNGYEIEVTKDDGMMMWTSEKYIADGSETIEEIINNLSWKEVN